MKKQLILKHDLAVNWAKAVNFIPKADELILYDGILEDGVYTELPRLKRGDGVTKLADLPFLDDLEIIASLEATNYNLVDEILEIFN